MTAKEPGQKRGPRWAAAVSRSFGPRAGVGGTNTVSVHSVGEGPDVVLVPGLAVSRYLRPAQELLAAGARVHLIEYPGTADAPDVSGTPALRDDAAALSRWLRDRLGRPALLVGHSYGTQVAARAAAADDGCVNGLLLASPTLDPKYRALRKVVPALLADGRTHSAELVATNRPQQRRAGLARLFAMATSMLADAPERWLAQVAAPVTVLMGSNDALGTQTWGRQLANRQGDRFVPVAGGRHTFPFDQPGTLAHAVRTCLGRTRTDELPRT